MKFVDLDLRGLIEIVPARSLDERGYFSETFHQGRFRDRVGPYNFLQDNQSLSRRAGTIRGLHFQTPPNDQGKLVQCVAGSMFDVAVDLRQRSPTYGKWAAVTLTSAAGNQLWIPPGFAHGFCTLEPETIVSYKVTAYYSPNDDRGIAWDDPDIAVAWPDIAEPETLSTKDRAQPAFRDLQHSFHIQD